MRAIPNITETVEGLKFKYVAGGNIKWSNHFGKTFKEIAKLCTSVYTHQMARLPHPRYLPERNDSIRLQKDLSQMVDTAVFTPAKLLSSPMSIKRWRYIPDRCGSVGWTSSCKVKGHWLNSRSGHMPGLQVRSPIRVRTTGNWWVFLSHLDVSPSLSPSLPLSLKLK